jgi:choline-glycine betaine transporter
MESEDMGEWALALIDYMMVLAQQNVLVAIATLLALFAVPVVALTHMMTGPVVIDVGEGAAAGCANKVVMSRRKERRQHEQQQHEQQQEQQQQHEQQEEEQEEQQQQQEQQQVQVAPKRRSSRRA